MCIGTKVGDATLAAVFGRYYKAVAVTDILTFRLEPLRDSSTEREEETYAEVKHHVDKSFYAGDIEVSMLNGINKCAGMVATSKKMRQMSDPTGKREGPLTFATAAVTISFNVTDVCLRMRA